MSMTDARNEKVTDINVTNSNVAEGGTHSISARAALTCVSWISKRTTSNPAEAKIMAHDLPINPDPTIPTFPILFILTDFYRIYFVKFHV